MAEMKNLKIEVVRYQTSQVGLTNFVVSDFRC